MIQRHKFDIEGWRYELLWDGPGFYGKTNRGDTIEVLKLAEFGATAISIIKEQKRRNCTDPMMLEVPEDFRRR